MKLLPFLILFTFAGGNAFAQTKEIVINKMPDPDKSVILEQHPTQQKAQEEANLAAREENPFIKEGLEIPKIPTPSSNPQNTSELKSPDIKDEPVVVYRTLKAAKQAGIDPLGENKAQPVKPEASASKPQEVVEEGFKFNLSQIKQYLLIAAMALVAYILYNKKHKSKNEKN